MSTEQNLSRGKNKLMKLLLNYSASRCFIANFSVSCSLQGSGDWLLACGPIRCGTAEWDDAVYYRSTLDKGLRLTLRSVQIWVNSVSDGEHLNTRQTEAHNTHWYQCNIITCCGVHQQSKQAPQLVLHDLSWNPLPGAGIDSVIKHLSFAPQQEYSSMATSLHWSNSTT